MELSHVNFVFQLIVLLFAVSLHESAHAWTAWRMGDPTARMLGRVTLNPVKHIDPFGSILVPVMTGLIFPMVFHVQPFPFGWAKPTPVNTRNFKHFVRDDALTSIAGPVSNFLLAVIAVALLKVIMLSSGQGRTAAFDALWFVLSPGDFRGFQTSSALVPISVLLANALYLNVILAIFNLIPIPPLDGSHVLRHLLPSGMARAFDSIGMVGLLLAFTVGSRILGYLLGPVLSLFILLLRW